MIGTNGESDVWMCSTIISWDIHGTSNVHYATVILMLDHYLLGA